MIMVCGRSIAYSLVMQDLPEPVGYLVRDTLAREGASCRQALLDALRH
jgi:hypothetical protein